MSARVVLILPLLVSAAGLLPAVARAQVVSEAPAALAAPGLGAPGASALAPSLKLGGAVSILSPGLSASSLSSLSTLGPLGPVSSRVPDASKALAGPSSSLELPCAAAGLRAQPAL